MLISNIDTLKKYIPTVVGGDFGRYSTYLETADEYLVSELIGQTIYDTLLVVEDPAEGEVGAASDVKLVRYCENVVALKGYLDAIPFLDLVETETGFAVVSDVNNNVVPASKDRVEKLIRGLESRLSDAIEQLLEHLEGNEDYYDPWKSAKAYALNHDSYIFTLKQFRQYARYDGSRIEWIKDMPKVTRAIRYSIEPIISSALSATIIKELQDDDLGEANKLIIEDLRFSLAAFVTGDKENGRSFLYRARKTILDDVDSYQEFKDSTIYTEYLAATSGFSVDQSIASFGV